MLKKVSGLIIAAIIAISFNGFTSCAESNDSEPVLYKMNATAYCLEGITASGKQVRKGICATGDKKYLGMTAIVYQRLPGDNIGKIIGIYEVEDTGCSEYVIDVWMPDTECQSFMDTVYEDGCKGKVWVQFMEANG